MFGMLIPPPPATNVRWVYDDPSGVPEVPAQAA
jgi:hypothetical protein